jgi:uncharacterized phiE125 gp8 family phage protein
VYSHQLVTPPATSPVTLADAKTQLRIDASVTADDAFITGLIANATNYMEEATGRAIIDQTWKLVLDGFPGASGNDQWWDGVREGHVNTLFGQSGPIELLRHPAKSITSITTFTQDDVSSVVPSTTYLLNSSAARVTLRNGKTWPVSLREFDAVEILYVAGYGADGTLVPRGLRQGILVCVAHWYENREIIQGGDAFVAFAVGEIPHTLSDIIARYKVMKL